MRISSRNSNPPWRQVSTHTQSRRDPAEGRANFSPSEDASVGAVQEPPAEWAGPDLPQQDVLKELEEPARAKREGQRPSPKSSTLRFVAKPPTGEKNRADDLTLTDNGDGTYTPT